MTPSPHPTKSRPFRRLPRVFTSPLTIRITADMRDVLEEIAAKQNGTLAMAVREAIEKAVATARAPQPGPT